MLGMYNLLPLLKGWDYRFRTWTRTVKRGETVEVDRIDESGWLIDVTLLTNDCYGGINFEWQGGDLDLHTIGSHPELANTLGAFTQDPAGWLQLYNRPNPASTLGAYFLIVYTGGYQGSIFPYVPTSLVKLYLTEDSTQAEATISGGAVSISVTSPQLFIRSLRSVLGMPTILPIDPALLVGGREELTLKGPLEKESKKK